MADETKATGKGKEDEARVSVRALRRVADGYVVDTYAVPVSVLAKFKVHETAANLRDRALARMGTAAVKDVS